MHGHLVIVMEGYLHIDGFPAVNRRPVINWGRQGWVSIDAQGECVEPIFIA